MLFRSALSFIGVLLFFPKMYYCSSKNSFDFSLLLHYWNTYLRNIKNFKNESNLCKSKLLRKENLIKIKINNEVIKTTFGSNTKY